MLPPEWRDRLRLPALAAPMTDVSGPDLVAAACAAGVIGAFPTHNAANPTDLASWLDRIRERAAALAPPGVRPAPVAANLVVHASNARLADDLRAVVRGGVELVITSVGSPRQVVGPLHDAGVAVLADVASLRHVGRAVDSGVDGVVLLTAGAGGQTGWANPFAFLRAVRQRYDGVVVLAGGVSDGAGILAAQVLGADLCYLGTRFIATSESLASPDYRAAVVAATLDDVTTSTQVTGLAANVLTAWMHGIEPSARPAEDFSVDRLLAQRGVWAAGHSVSGAADVVPVAVLVRRLVDELEHARRALASAATTNPPRASRGPPPRRVLLDDALEVMMWGTLPEVFDRVCLYYADRTAIRDQGRSLTYRQMQQWANRVANGLGALGVTPGERIGLLLPNVLEFIPTQHGIWKAGATLVQMPTRAPAATQRANLDQTGATTLIYHADYDEVARELVAGLPGLKNVIRLGGSGPAGTVDYRAHFDAQPDTSPSVRVHEHDEAYVLFTSGSTGEPKGVVNSHFTWAHYSITAGLEIGDTRPGEVFAHGAPLTHFTQIFVMPTFIRGGTNVMLPGLDVDGLLTTIERERVTATAVVPTIVYLLLDHPRRTAADLSSLQTMIYAGSPIAPDRLKEALAAFGPIFVQTYAGTDPGYVSCLRKEEHRVDSDLGRKRLASAGRPIPYVAVTIQDERDRPLPVGEIGEICSRQLGQMLGYVDASRNSEALRDGWVHTGDIGYLDEDGFLYIVDRKRDMVVSGGFNVFPRQVEDALLAHPAVAQAAVIGVPHPKWGEAVHAVVVLREGAQVETDELSAAVKRQLGSVSAPKTMVFAEALPVNPAGKVDKKSLRAPFWAGRSRQVG